MGHVNSYQQDPTLCSSIVYQLSETSGGQVRTRTAGKTITRSTSNATLNTQDSKELEMCGETEAAKERNWARHEVNPEKRSGYSRCCFRREGRETAKRQRAEPRQDPQSLVILCHKGQDKLPRRLPKNFPHSGRLQEQVALLPSFRPNSGNGSDHAAHFRSGSGKWKELRGRWGASVLTTGSSGCGRGAATWHCVPLSGFVPWRGTTLADVFRGLWCGRPGRVGVCPWQAFPPPPHLGGAVSTLRVSSLLRLWLAIWQSSGCHWNQA